MYQLTLLQTDNTHPFQGIHTIHTVPIFTYTLHGKHCHQSSYFHTQEHTFR